MSTPWQLQRVKLSPLHAEFTQNTKNKKFRETYTPKCSFVEEIPSSYLPFPAITHENECRHRSSWEHPPSIIKPPRWKKENMFLFIHSLPCFTFPISTPVPSVIIAVSLTAARQVNRTSRSGLDVLHKPHKQQLRQGLYTSYRITFPGQGKWVTEPAVLGLMLGSQRVLLMGLGWTAFFGVSCDDSIPKLFFAVVVYIYICFPACGVMESFLACLRPLDGGLLADAWIFTLCKLSVCLSFETHLIHLIYFLVKCTDKSCSPV